MSHGQRYERVLAMLHKAATEAEVRKATAELGKVTRCIVVRVREDESEQQARTRTFAMHPWYLALSDKARARVSVIVVTRGHGRGSDRRTALGEADTEAASPQ